jgi:ABC-2 type transport system ATP-binding protein
MRMIMGLDRPTSGSATINAKQYASLRFPLHVVGASLDAGALHPSRSARNHLEWIADSNSHPSTAGCSTCWARSASHEVGHRRAGELSLGYGPALRDRCRHCWAIQRS